MRLVESDGEVPQRQACVTRIAEKVALFDKASWKSGWILVIPVQKGVKENILRQ